MSSVLFCETKMFIVTKPSVLEDILGGLKMFCNSVQNNRF